MRVEVRPRATLGLIEQAAFIHEHSPSAAIRFQAALREVFGLLAEYPHIGHEFPFDHGANAVRRFVRPRGFPNHVVLYRVREEFVEVLDIFHAAQDPRRRGE